MDVVRDPTTAARSAARSSTARTRTAFRTTSGRVGRVTPEALDYLQIPLFSSGNTELRTVTASMSSDLGEYGIKSPGATDGIGVAFGVDYLEQSLDFETDPNFESGDGAGQGGPTIGTVRRLQRDGVLRRSAYAAAAGHVHGGEPAR